MAGEGGAGGAAGLVGGLITSLPDLLSSFDKPTSEEVWQKAQRSAAMFSPYTPNLERQPEWWRGVRTSGTRVRAFPSISGETGPPLQLGAGGLLDSPFTSAFAGFSHLLPGRSSPVPQAPGTPQKPDWRQGVTDLAYQSLRLWLYLRQRRQAADAARRAARAQAQWLSNLLARLRGVTGGRTVDLLQLSAGSTGGIGSLFGGEQSSLGGWGSLIAGLGSAAGSVIRSLSGNEQEVLAGYGDPWGPNILYPTSERANAAINASLAAGCGSPFTAGGAALRPSTFSMANPATGKLTWFRPAGKPVLWSSDFAACRRVGRVARKARRRVGGR